jgi:hypothetical protein
MGFAWTRSKFLVRVDEHSSKPSTKAFSNELPTQLRPIAGPCINLCSSADPAMHLAVLAETARSAPLHTQGVGVRVLTRR